MITPNPVDKQRIALKLNTFQLVLDSNIELLEQDPRLKEQLDLKMQVAQHYMKELDTCEKAGDPVNYNSAFDRVALLLEDVHDLLHLLLDGK